MATRASKKSVSKTAKARFDKLVAQEDRDLADGAKYRRATRLSEQARRKQKAAIRAKSGGKLPRRRAGG